jgi:hypothetical protein
MINPNTAHLGKEKSDRGVGQSRMDAQDMAAER